MKGKLDQSSCGELVHMIVLVFIIYWSSFCSSFCRVFQLLQLLAALDQCTHTIFRKESAHLLAGLPCCLLLLRGFNIVEICARLLLWSLATCPPHFHFRISARPAMSFVFCQLSYLSLNEILRIFRSIFLWQTWRCFFCTLVKFQVWHPYVKHEKMQGASALNLILQFNFLSSSMNFNDENALFAKAVLLFNSFSMVCWKSASWLKYTYSYTTAYLSSEL